MTSPRKMVLPYLDHWWCGGEWYRPCNGARAANVNVQHLAEPVAKPPVVGHGVVPAYVRQGGHEVKADGCQRDDLLGYSVFPCNAAALASRPNATAQDMWNSPSSSLELDG